jgi:hypothetical protein
MMGLADKTVISEHKQTKYFAVKPLELAPEKT